MVPYCEARFEYHWDKHYKMQRHTFLNHQDKLEQFELSKIERILCQKNKRKLVLDQMTGELKPSGTLKRLSCTVEGCTKRVSSPSHLKNHLLTHTDERTEQCSECGKGFKYEKRLRRHIALTHTGEAKYSCNLCTRVYFFPFELKEHMRKHTGA